jgi:hypothetical protein
MIRNSSVISALLLVLLSACETWPPDGVEDTGGPTIGWQFTCDFECTGLVGSVITTRQYRRGTVCSNGSGPFFDLATATTQAGIICGRGIATINDAMCTEDDWGDHPYSVTAPGVSCTYEVTPITIDGELARCEGPCSPGVMTRAPSGTTIRLDPNQSFANVTSHNGTEFPTVYLDGEVLLEGGDCVGGGCDVTLNKIEFHSLPGVSQVVGGVAVRNFQAVSLGHPTRTVSPIGSWVMGPETLRFDVSVSIPGQLTRYVFEPFTNFSPTNFRYDPTSGLFTANAALTDEVGNAYSVTLVGAPTNLPPVALADVEVGDGNCGGSTVTLDASASSDPDADALGYIWVLDAESTRTTLSREPVATVNVPAGNHTITLEVEDTEGGTDRITLPISVEAGADTTPPTIVDARVASDCIWPPNHQYAVYEIGRDIIVDAMDNCGSVDVQVTAVSSEPDDGVGDGSTGEDVVVGEGGVCLRAERSGTAEGRTYTVTVVATDGAGNIAERELTVDVPHDRRGGRTCARGNETTCPLPPPAQQTEPGESTSGLCTASPGASQLGGVGFLVATLFALGFRRRQWR